MTARRKGEPQDVAPPPTGSFGDSAGKMAEETQVEEPVAPGQAPAADQAPPEDENDLIVPGEPPAEPQDEPQDEPRDEPPDAPPDEPAEEIDPLAVAEQALAERTADLQRLQAEYLNYKRRVDRDRELVRENATYAALAPIVEVLDTIDRAREHGDLDEGFQAVADQLERVVAHAGLVKYGEPGEAFDPRLHEALSHIGEDPEVEVTTVKVIAKAGYRIGDRVVRVAQVLVVDPGGA